MKCRVWARLSYPVYEVKVTTQLTLEGVELRQRELLQLAVATQERCSGRAAKRVKVSLELLQLAVRFLPLLLRQLPLCFSRFRLFLRFMGVFLIHFTRLQPEPVRNAAVQTRGPAKVC